MKNMTLKEKFLFIFLQIATVGLIWIYWKKQGQKYKNQYELSQEIKIGVNVIKLINLLGKSENIKEVTNTHTKVKITYNDREKVEVEQIKNMAGVSGVFMNDQSIVLIVGNSAKSLVDSIKRNM